MPSIIDIYRAVRFMGIKNSIQTIRYSILRDRLDAIWRKRNQLPAQSILPGAIQDIEKTKRGARLSFENAELEIEYLTPGMVRVSWLGGVPPAPYAIDRESWPPVEVELDQDSSSSSTQLKAALAVEIRDDGGIQFSLHGRALRATHPPTRQGTSWVERIVLTAGEQLYGLGEQSGPLDLSTRSHMLWAQDPGGSYEPGKDPLYMPMPVYFGLHQSGYYLVFYENHFRGSFTPVPTLGTTSQPGVELAFENGMLRYYLVAGSLEEIYTQYTELTGRAPLPPRWSLGYHQSRWGYKSENDIREVVSGFQTHDLPLDAIHLDIDYMRGYRVFTVDEQRFPDLARLATDLAEQGIHLVTIIDPGVKIDPEYFVFKEGVEQDAFCKLPNGKLSQGLVWPGWSAYPDFTNSRTRDWWGGYYRLLLAEGISGFWHDMNEPTSQAAWGGMDLPLSTRHALDGQTGDHHAAHNLYAFQMNRTAYDALRSIAPDRRPWLLSRSGWVGQQRYAWNWTGDTGSTWESLKMTVASVIGLSLSGIPFTGPDTGGFSGDPSPELFIRWFQMSALLPFFRSHAAITTQRREPWVYGEPYLSITRDFLQLRASLLPYLYTLAWEHTQRGLPLVRPLFWLDPADQNLWDIDDAFLLGSALLVAPLVEADQSAREIYLPQGEWYDFWNGTAYPGGTSIHLETGLERIPIFVRGGTLLPQTYAGDIQLSIYPGEGRGHLYSDAGDGYGDHRLDTFVQQQDAQGGIVSWNTSGAYPFPYRQIIIQLITAHSVTMKIDGQLFEHRQQVKLGEGFKTLNYRFLT